jgi:hypothetical protein
MNSRRPSTMATPSTNGRPYDIYAGAQVALEKNLTLVDARIDSFILVTGNLAARKWSLIIRKLVLEASQTVRMTTCLLDLPRESLSSEDIVQQHAIKDPKSSPIIQKLANALENMSSHLLETESAFRAALSSHKQRQQQRRSGPGSFLGSPEVVDVLKEHAAILTQKGAHLRNECASFRESWRIHREEVFVRVSRGMDIQPNRLEDYTQVIQEAWFHNRDFFVMQPDFHHRKMDVSSSQVDPEIFIELGRAWIGERLPPGDIVLPRSEISSSEQRLQRAASVIKAPSDISDLERLGLRTDALKIWGNIFEHLSNSFKDIPLRIAFVGLVNQGKSSAINALLGRILLQASGKLNETPGKMLI